MSCPKPRPDVFRVYWYFAAERQRIFEARLQDPVGPWSEDEIFQDYRFCNAYRASDRVTQDLIRVAYAGPQNPDDLFVRVVLHRLFSKPATFALLEDAVGTLSAATFDARKLGSALDSARARQQTIYTGAFILCAGAAYGHRTKHRNHLALVSAMLEARVPARIRAARTLRDVYEELLTWPLLGPFMAYQLAIDLNYTELTDFNEDEFTVPGPGALRGLAKVFEDLGDLAPPDAVRWLVDEQHEVAEKLEITPPTLFSRPLKAIDCQNLLCEVDKYSRVRFPELRSNRSRIKQRFVADLTPIRLFYPPRWGINARAERASAAQLSTCAA